ncbi:hypothetical protein [Empedobacter sedimenti]|uniref:hypothetical protein n=1 Tax=Empedobacter sedimenti TaxID=3042610 RepID=UPI002A4E13B9|nr:hypothetical protein [Empedobacter sedimenti]
MISPLKSRNIEGLIYAETMSAMILGSPIYSTSRFLSNEIVVFAQWENENALDKFLLINPIGKKLSKSWYLKLEFIRRWGNISGFQIPKNSNQDNIEINPAVAVTLARMKFMQIPRFIRWGRPVEKMVRDHSGTTLSLASIRYPNLISTFSIWKTQKEMTDMVHGHSKMPQPKRHFNAMKERNRKDFHFEFTTLRFKVLAEFGEWKGKSNFTLIKNN